MSSLGLRNLQVLHLDSLAASFQPTPFHKRLLKLPRQREQPFRNGLLLDFLQKDADPWRQGICLTAPISLVLLLHE